MNTETNQYHSSEVDESRLKVTSCRSIVERIHSRIKIFKFLQQENNATFLKNHLEPLSNFVIASLNKFGFSRRTGVETESFPAPEIFQTLSGKHPRKFYSNLNDFLLSQTHPLSYKKRANWTEMRYTEVSKFFPKLSEREIESMSGGVFGLEKAKKYRKHILKVFEERAELLRSNSRSNSTYASGGVVKTFRTMFLDKKMAKDFLEADQCLRLDIPSYFGSTRKFITAIACRNSENQMLFDTACTCSTGSRSTPCVHGTLAFYLFCNFLKKNEQMEA